MTKDIDRDEWMDDVLTSDLPPAKKATLVDWYDQIGGAVPAPTIPEKTGNARLERARAFQDWARQLRVADQGWSRIARRIARWLLEHAQSGTERAELTALLEDDALEREEFAEIKVRELIRHATCSTNACSVT